METLKQKLMAFLLHLLMSALVIAVVIIIMRNQYYPGPLFRIEDVWQGLKILIPVDAILGPLLTFALYRKGKKNMTQDISIIAVIQIAALLYGVHSIYRVRPAVLVFAGDRFDVITQIMLDKHPFPKERFTSPLNTITLAYATPPSNHERVQMFLKGEHYQRDPNRYYPLKNYHHEIIKHRFDLNNYKPTTPAEIQKIKLFKSKYSDEKLSLFILQGTTYDIGLIALDSHLNIAGYLDINPWLK